MPWRPTIELNGSHFTNRNAEQVTRLIVNNSGRDLGKRKQPPGSISHGLGTA